jgi:carbamoyltransferase
MNRNYIGLANTFHDSALAIVNSSGEVVFAEATERYTQCKRAININPDLFAHTLAVIQKHCAIGTELIPAFSWSSKMRGFIDDKMRALAALKEDMSAKFGALSQELDNRFSLPTFTVHAQHLFLSQPGLGLSFELSQGDGRNYRSGISRHYDHHLTHATTGCLTSPFDKAVCAVIDGFGEREAFDCYSYERGKLTQIEIPARSREISAGSLGSFYATVCSLCGFNAMSGEEWKVMGLAPYGNVDNEIYDLLKTMIWVDGLSIESPSGYKAQQIQHKLNRFGRKENESSITAANIAYAGQRVFTEVLLKYLNNLYERDISDNLVLAGGCALNSSANGQILSNTPFKRLHVFSAPGDDGNAIGAALLAFQEDHPNYRPPQKYLMPYLGSKMSVDTLKSVKKFSRIPKLTECKDDAPERAAEMLSQGKIIGWVQGCAEFGPRALGNRSILADPRSPDIKEAINSRVKFREEFRPFAPSILHEFGPQYFEHYQESPYMERTLKFKPEVMSLVPGVVHEDGTGRLQTVKKEWNERYYRLIQQFWKLTDVPLVLNTSFNVMGKPISHSVEDVLAVFYTSGLDAVFIDDLLIEK